MSPTKRNPGKREAEAKASPKQKKAKQTKEGLKDKDKSAKTRPNHQDLWVDMGGNGFLFQDYGKPWKTSLI